MKLTLLDKDSLEHTIYLSDMLVKFQEEVFGSDTEIDIDTFIKYHFAIYLAIIDGECIGFTSFVINSYYGLREPTIGNDYIYIVKGHRRSRAMHLFSLQSGKVCIENNLPLEHYIASESSDRLSKRLSGKKIFTAYIYEVEEVERVFNKLKTKVRINDEDIQ